MFSLISKIFPQMSLEWLASETRRNLPKELNFLLEGQNADELRARLSQKLSFLKVINLFIYGSTDGGF